MKRTKEQMIFFQTIDLRNQHVDQENLKLPVFQMLPDLIPLLLANLERAKLEKMTMRSPSGPTLPQEWAEPPISPRNPKDQLWEERKLLKLPSLTICYPFRAGRRAPTPIWTRRMSGKRSKTSTSLFTTRSRSRPPSENRRGRGLSEKNLIDRLRRRTNVRRENNSRIRSMRFSRNNILSSLSRRKLRDRQKPNRRSSMISKIETSNSWTKNWENGCLRKKNSIGRDKS